MSTGKSIGRSLFAVAAVCTFAMTGCAATMVPSQRLHEPGLSQMMNGQIPVGGQRFGMPEASGCTSCEDRQRLQDYAHHAMPYVAGPFMHRRAATEYVAQQATIQPPHSKFHPVPTRPVFEARASYHPPLPMGVQLVPVPDQEFNSTTPQRHAPDSPLGPNSTTSEAMDAAELDGFDGFILSPPGN